ncbi:MAG TPA: toll/interleukin-1 receptor domain-containing protein [Ktedonobacteraceae bacterium]
MANQEQLDILRQGTTIWNTWRKQYREVRIDLSNASLKGANLSEADLSRADLNGADLARANFDGANFSYANLDSARFIEATLNIAYLRKADCKATNFRGASLIGADLWGADLGGADLEGANLWGANLSAASLIGTDLSATNLSEATMGWTIFANIDLCPVKGLDTVRHEGPSTIGIDTLLRSQGDIPEAFLRGAGLPDTFISYARALVQNPIEYYTCFISYSSKDQDFAERLYADLQSKGVRCWFAPEDLKIGEKFWHRIDESIRLYDKLLVVLSLHSVESAWVEREVTAALEKEQQQQKLVLFPITLDEAFKGTFAPWAADIRRQRHIGDFSQWKDHDSYQKSLSRLLRDLKAGTK